MRDDADPAERHELVRDRRVGASDHHLVLVDARLHGDPLDDVGAPRRALHAQEGDLQLRVHLVEHARGDLHLRDVLAERIGIDVLQEVFRARVQAEASQPSEGTLLAVAERRHVREDELVGLLVVPHVQNSLVQHVEVRVLREEYHGPRAQLGDDVLEPREGRAREQRAQHEVQQLHEADALEHDDDYDANAAEVEGKVAHVVALAHEVAQKRREHANHPERCVRVGDVHLARQARALELEHDGANAEAGHDAEEGEGVHAAQAAHVAVEHDDLRGGEEEEHERGVVRGAAPAILVEEELGQHAVARHAAGEAVDAHVAGEHGAAEHHEGVHAHEELQDAAERCPRVAHARDAGDAGERVLEPVPGLLRDDGEEVALRFFHVRHGEYAERDERDDGVEEGHAEPHVAQSLHEDARRLLLDELAARLEAGHAEHARAGAEEERREHVPRDDEARDLHRRQRRREVRPEVPALRADHEHEAQQHEEAEREEVQHEDEHGNARRLAYAPGIEQREEGVQHHDAGDERQVRHEHLQVADGRGRRDDARGNVADDGEAGSGGRHGLARRVDEHVVRPAVHADGRDGLAVDALVQPQDARHQRQAHRREHARALRHLTRHVEAARQDVVAADGGGLELAQLVPRVHALAHGAAGGPQPGGVHVQRHLVAAQRRDLPVLHALVALAGRARGSRRRGTPQQRRALAGALLVGRHGRHGHGAAAALPLLPSPRGRASTPFSSSCSG
mmetsp:Transcript_9955/g.29282  ORF Transcript_9955/g.29282 Transcript_9955/m.29282 type:complete len:737 (-) Transcript_9955:94-2304(-)